MENCINYLEVFHHPDVVDFVAMVEKDYHVYVADVKLAFYDEVKSIYQEGISTDPETLIRVALEECKKRLEIKRITLEPRHLYSLTQPYMFFTSIIKKNTKLLSRNDVYEEVEKRVAPLLKGYYKDLYVHDRDAILNSDVPFLHFTRPLGTHILLMNDSEAYPAKGEVVKYLFGMADREHILRACRDVVEYAVERSETKLALYYDGENLREVDGIEALEIVDTYIYEMRVEWGLESA